MKKIILFFATLVLTIVSVAQVNQDLAINDLLHSKQVVNSSSKNSYDQTWLSKAENNISKQEYYFKRMEASFNMFFCAANRKQQLGFDINPLGYSASPLQLGDKPIINTWKEQFDFLTIKKGNNIVLSKGEFEINEGNSKISYNYKGFSIQYTNDEQGLRQNFIINKKPIGHGNIQLLLNIDGTLSPVIKNNGLQFNDESGTGKFYYRDLHVWDANHQTLSARMELRDENVLAIIVDDKNAKYPITIDPINQTPEWSGSANGILPTLINQLAVDAAYGFCVAGVGDLNGDGYDDVAIGAPTLVNIISGTGELASVGAVFVYYGSDTGLSAVPGAMLQPTTCVAGALFGYSIAGGDINDDGKSDIVVGAPLDQVTLSIGSGDSASGTVGKVYAFSGASLSTNTSPFITIQLNGTGILQNNINLSVNALFGFSVAVTDDLNGDGKNDIIVGAPTYAGITTNLLGNSVLDVQSGGAFVFLSNDSNNNYNIEKLQPIQSSLLGVGLLSSNINGLLFGYSVDGAGDYNNDGKPDVVASAPAGIDVSSLSALLNGKLLQGSVNVYYGNGSGVNTTAGATLAATSGGLLTNFSGTIANIANLFGVSVKGVKSITGVRNGNIIVGAPLGGTIVNVLSLELKTGTVNVFKKKSTSPSGYVTPDQVLSSPRNSNNVLGLIQSNLLFGYSLDNTMDLNCDGYPDIIVGEPVSSGAQLLNANIAGGAAYVYFGNSDGTYQTTPAWTLTANEDAFLGINATSLIGYSVAGAGWIKGYGNSPRILVGSPSRTLDFGSGLLNLGSTFGTLFSLVAGNNGVGKAYEFDSKLCSQGGPLAITLTQLKGVYENGVSHLTWNTLQEINSSYFEIERSVDGENFTTIGKVNAAGNSSSSLDYSFEDTKASVGNNFYRLKMVSEDGNIQYSNIVLLEVDLNGTNITNIYPSPFIDKVNVDISSAISGQLNIRLFDNAGKMVANQQSVITKGNNTVIFSGLSNIAKGLYMIEVSSGSKTIIQKLIKQ